MEVYLCKNQDCLCWIAFDPRLLEEVVGAPLCDQVLTTFQVPDGLEDHQIADLVWSEFFPLVVQKEQVPGHWIHFKSHESEGILNQEGVNKAHRILDMLFFLGYPGAGNRRLIAANGTVLLENLEGT